MSFTIDVHHHILPDFFWRETIRLVETAHRPQRLPDFRGYCLAHHVQVQEGRRSLMVASIRYLDTFTKQAGRWLFSERRLIVDWIETRPL